jgi:serine protease AprX
MRRTVGGTADGSRASALWGTGNRGDERSSALWGTGNRGGEHRSPAPGRRALAVVAAAFVALALPLSASAGGGTHSYVAPGVIQAAGKAKGKKLDVVIQAAPGAELSKKAINALGSVKREFKQLGMVTAEIPANKVEMLRDLPGLIVTLDAPVQTTGYTSSQLWPSSNGLTKLWPSGPTSGPAMPAIAIVDSGIDTDNLSFGKRVVARQTFGRGSSGSGRDSRGHGTFVAGIAAGEAPGYAGAAPTAPLVDLDVMDETGMAYTSDVIAACEWILKNKAQYNIRVANLSLHAASILSIRYHPLNRAVEKLWFAGVTVVTAAGNYGRADGPSGVVHAPGNDPFVLTVGALDLGNKANAGDDSIAYWSAYGYTLEGFAKPEVVAPGRYLVGPVPMTSTLVAEKPDKVVAPGYLQLSGTSFAAPVVAGLAAHLLARHPEYTPDQVKGAIMATARRVPGVQLLQQGRGEVNAVRAVNVKSAPNPNLALNRFLGVDPAGGNLPVFDAAAWAEAAWSEAAWSEAAWSEAAWSENGADAAWAEAAWSEAAWNEAAWSEASWSEAAWSEAAQEDNAEGESEGQAPALTPEAAAELAADPDLQLPLEALLP